MLRISNKQFCGISQNDLFLLAGVTHYQGVNKGSGIKHTIESDSLFYFMYL